MRRRAWGWLAILSIAACSGWAARPLDVAALKRSGPRTVTVAISETPDLLTETEGLPLFLAGGLLASATAQHASAKGEATRAMGIEDPAATARRRVVAGLVQGFGLSEKDTRSFVTTASTPEAIAGDYRGVDLIIDLRTVRWGLRATRERDGLWLEYVGTLRLIDGRSGAVLADGTCAAPGPGSDDQFPTLKTLSVGDWMPLKRELWVAGNRCADHFLARVFKLPLG